jgi:hypothetical protein
VLEGGRSSEIGGELSEIKDRLSGIGRVETSGINEEESSESGGYCLGGSRVSSIIVTNEEKISLSTSRNCIQSGEIVMF